MQHIGDVSRVVVRHEVDEAGLARLRRPRNDIVAEIAVEADTYELAEGPFQRYHRSLAVEEDGGRCPTHRVVVETIDYRLAIPYFGFLFWWPVRRAMRQPPSTDGTQPWWSPPQRLDARSAAIMGTLAAVVILSGYLSNAPAETHTYAADEFGVDQLSQGTLGAVVRVGTLLALPASILADRTGRRRILAVAMVVGIAASLLAAIAPTFVAFGAVLVVTRTANATLGAMVTIIAIEEMPAGSRAWALSILGMTAALGAGTVVWFQPLAGIAEWTWRLIYLLPIVMIPFVMGILRRLPESRRFERRRVDVRLRDYASRMALLGTVFFLIALFLSPIDWFRGEYLRDEHGFSAGRVSLLVLISATPGGLGLYVAGRIADVRGRRIVIATATVFGLGCIVAFYNATGLALWALAMVASIVASGLLPSIGVFRGEMFPTAIRARAAALAGAVGVVGGSLGIFLAGYLRQEWGAFGPVIGLLWAGPLVAAAVVWFRFTEGARRELEDLNPEDPNPEDPAPSS